MHACARPFKGNPIKWALLGDVAWRSRLPSSSSGMIDDIQAWVVAYAMRRYPSTSVEANTHVATAWTALLNSAYGGNHTQVADAAQSQSQSQSQSRSATPPPTRPPAAQAVGTGMAQGLDLGSGSGSGSGLGSHDSDIFSKDGLARFPSFSLNLYSSPNTTGIESAWNELLSAAEVDPTIEHGAAFRYDLVDVVRQSLQNIFAKTFASLTAVCGGSPDHDFGLRADASVVLAGTNYTEYSSSNCGGASDDSPSPQKNNHFVFR